MSITHTDALAAHFEDLGIPVTHIHSDGTLVLRSDAWHMQAEAEAARDAWIAAGNDTETFAELRRKEYEKIPLYEYLEALTEAVAESRTEKLAALNAKRQVIKSAIK